MLLLTRLSTRQKIAIARALNRCIRIGRAALRRPMQGEFLRGGIKWSLDLNEGIDFAIYLLGTFERDLAKSYRQLVPTGVTILDIGANIGAHTLPLAKHVSPSGRVVAIEATAYAFAKLQKNLSLNPSLQPQTTAVQALLTAKDEDPAETAISSSWPLAGSEKTDAVLCGALRSTSGARVCKLDTLIRELKIEKVDWIKLDVDGHELTVLQGANRLLQEYRPSIFMELAPYCYREQPELFGELVGTLRDMDYRFYRLPSMAPINCNPTVLTREIPKNGSINVLASRF